MPHHHQCLHCGLVTPVHSEPGPDKSKAPINRSVEMEGYEQSNQVSIMNATHGGDWGVLWATLQEDVCAEQVGTPIEHQQWLKIYDGAVSTNYTAVIALPTFGNNCPNWVNKCLCPCANPWLQFAPNRTRRFKHTIFPCTFCVWQVAQGCCTLALCSTVTGLTPRQK